MSLILTDLEQRFIYQNALIKMADEILWIIFNFRDLENTSS